MRSGKNRFVQTLRIASLIALACIASSAFAEASGVKTLAYSRPTEHEFNIDIETAEGEKFQINLSSISKIVAKRSDRPRSVSSCHPTN